MNHEITFTDTELNSNPLLRKMRDRFTCSGNMTIGEIMLHRAERDDRNTSTPATFMAPTFKTESASAAVAVIEEPVRAIESPMRSSRRALLLSCTAIALCTVVLLAFIIPVFSNFNTNATAEVPEAEVVNTSIGEPVPAVEEEIPVSSNFDNVLDSFSRTFGN